MERERKREGGGEKQIERKKSENMEAERRDSHGSRGKRFTYVAMEIHGLHMTPRYEFGNKQQRRLSPKKS